MSLNCKAPCFYISILLLHLYPSFTSPSFFIQDDCFTNVQIILRNVISFCGVTKLVVVVLVVVVIRIINSNGNDNKETSI